MANFSSRTSPWGNKIGIGAAILGISGMIEAGDRLKNQSTENNRFVICELVAQTCGGKAFCVYHGIVGVPRCNRCPLSAEEKRQIRAQFGAVRSVLYFFLN